MSHTLTIEPTGESVAVEEGQTILDACLRQGIWLPHACGHGLCGTCKVEVADGEVDHGDASGFALMDFERDGGKTLACTATLRSDVTIEADIDDEPDARRCPVRDFTGTVVGLEDLTHDVKGVTIELPGDGIAFQAGQYVNLTVPGVEGARAFSLASPPSRPGRIELHVRRVPGGRATGWIHDTLAVGDRLRLSGPYGRFFVRSSAAVPSILLAGGTGLSSPKSMILDLLERGWTQPILLIHGVRARRDLYDEALFRDLAARHPILTYVPVLSDPRPDDGWEGETGFVHEALQRRFDGLYAGRKAYLCGPPPMVEACIRTLMQGRLFERDIHTERFLTAGDGDAGKVRSPVFRRL
ncbi:phenol hydroxylase P5 protein [Azospirillum agricola]|uniref:NADH:ubiquinone reductase (Na(+)-transporting) subunit F n=1 Tax=Azospirillum agricola TaxID=1720247 RepID=UPI001AE0FB9C|nr:2Fe-2S iron-sulfur cluster binding domain-containing protein [Azospirillum agricola]MBP2227918.1 phenol hydroxylase P5 protein [Azospirillum agricola]